MAEWGAGVRGGKALRWGAGWRRLWAGIGA